MSDLLDLDAAKKALSAATKEEKDEAKVVLTDLISWAKGELDAGHDLDSLEWPKTGGALNGMSVDEALARTDAVNASLDAKKKRREEGEKLALTVIDTALRILTKVALASIA